MSFLSSSCVYSISDFLGKVKFLWGKILGEKGNAEVEGKCGLPCLPQDNGLLYASYTFL